MNDRADSPRVDHDGLRLATPAREHVGRCDTVVEAVHAGLREGLLPRPHPPLADRIAWNAVGSAVASGGRLLASLILARLLGAAEMGRYLFASWVIETVVLGINLGVPSALSRHLAEQQGRGELPNIVSVGRRIARWLFTASAIGGATAFALGLTWVFPGLGLPISVALGLLLCCQLWSGVAQAVLMGLQRFRALAVTNIGGTLCSLLAMGVGSALWGLYGAVGGAVMGFAASGGLAAYGIRDICQATDWSRTRADISSRAFWQYALNAWGAAVISAVVWGRMEFLFLERFAGYVQTAYFGVGLVFSSLTVQLVQLFTAGLMPHFAWCVGREDLKTLHKDYGRLTVLAAVIAFPVSALAGGVMPELLPLAFGGAYKEGVAAATWLAACGLWGFAAVGSAAVYGLGDAALIRRWSLVGAVLMAAGCWGLVPLYGAAGAAVVRFGVQGIMVAAGTLILRFRYGLPFPAVQLGKLMLSAGAAAIVARMVGVGGMGLAAGLAAGGTVYLLGIRVLGAIEHDVADGLLAVASRIPGRLGRVFAACVRLVARGA